MKEQTILPISVIIPTYNEEKYLPKLIESLKKQVFAPAEIVVADNNSQDKTPEIARAAGCKIVQGGTVAQGRNRGAVAASQELFLFLDADCQLPDEYYLGEMYIAFQKDNLDIMAALISPDKKEAGTPVQKAVSEMVFHGWNGLRRLYKTSKKLFAEFGGTILVKKAVFNNIEGFIEQHGLYGEDYHFTRKALEKGYKYKVYEHKILTSIRRVSTPTKATKTLLAGALMGAMFAFGLYNREKLVRVVQKLYGDLGGKPPEK